MTQDEGLEPKREEYSLTMRVPYFVWTRNACYRHQKQAPPQKSHHWSTGAQALQLLGTSVSRALADREPLTQRHARQ